MATTQGVTYTARGPDGQYVTCHIGPFHSDQVAPVLVALLDRPEVAVTSVKVIASWAEHVSGEIHAAQLARAAATRSDRIGDGRVARLEAALIEVREAMQAAHIYGDDLATANTHRHRLWNTVDQALFAHRDETSRMERAAADG